MFGQYADERLIEIDQALGSQSSEQIPYPNLRNFVNEQLFGFHVKVMDNTPIMWEFQTSRLVTDSIGEGFNCFVNYHQMDRNIFDRLQNHYIEPRKKLLRERRSAANRKRGDESLSASEQSEAVQEYDRCESGLEQIAVFEDRLAELAESDPREWPDENQKLAAEATELVAEFREETESRLETLDGLAALEEDEDEDVDMSELFADTFYETVEDNREEWIDALEDLETAFEAYAKDGSDPVEAHLYDLFEYFDDLVGSAHFASNGILFMTYYFDKFEDPDQTQLGDGGASKRQQHLSDLAAGVEEYQALASEIEDACDEIAGDISSDWSDRALSEITTAGYQPNHKHGVAINVTPLAEAEIVPEIVEDKVI